MSSPPERPGTRGGAGKHGEGCVCDDALRTSLACLGQTDRRDGMVVEYDAIVIGRDLGIERVFVRRHNLDRDCFDMVVVYDLLIGAGLFDNGERVSANVIEAKGQGAKANLSVSVVAHGLEDGAGSVDQREHELPRLQIPVLRGPVEDFFCLEGD